MIEYRVTFGVQYAHEPHPLWPPAHADGWLTIMAPNEQSARAAAMRVLGRAWCSIYPADSPWAKDDLDWYPRGELGRIHAT